MSDIPPKQTVNNIPFSQQEGGFSDTFTREPPFNEAQNTANSGALVSVHQAALHANPDSFPVLKAFQDYLEAERKSARRRMVMLSVFFVALMSVTIAGLIMVGFFVFKNMARQQEASARTQDVLLQTLLQRPATINTVAPDTQTPPQQPSSQEQLAAILLKLEQKLDAPPPRPKQEQIGATPSETVKTDPDATELAELKASLVAIKSENEKLQQKITDLATVEKPAPKVAAQTPPPASPPVKKPATAQPAPPPHKEVVRNPVPATTPKPEPAATATASVKAPLELPPENFAKATPLDGYREDIMEIPSRASKDQLKWRILMPTR